jgi:hypothetical protein
MVSPECSRKSGLCFDHDLRRPVGARPYHAAIGADVAGLHAMAEPAPVAAAVAKKCRRVNPPMARRGILIVMWASVRSGGSIAAASDRARKIV